MVPLLQTRLDGMYVLDLLTYGKLKCPNDEDCETFATNMCDFMNDCNGHGICNEETGGKCRC